MSEGSTDSTPGPEGGAGLDPGAGVDVDDWARDLTFKEVHLFTEGFYRGLRNMDPRPGKRLQGTVLAESWYHKGGYVLGWVTKALLVGTAAGAEPARAARIVDVVAGVI